jgi:hypothetical protein
MSAPYLELATSISSSGHTDGLGRRELCFDRETGAMLERLHVRPELAAFEAAIRERVARLAALEDPRFARTCSAERTRPSGELTVVSEFVCGIRLADLLETAREETLVPGVDVALGYLAEALSAVGALHLTVGFPHGLIAPDRTMFTADGRLVFLDLAYAAVVDRLGLSRRRLWTEFGIAAAPSTGAARLDAAGDLSQAALSAVMLILGRRLENADYPDNIPALLMEVVEVAQIRGSAAFAAGLQRLLQRLLPLPGRRPYSTADEALTDLRQLLRREIGVDVCQQALVEFIRQLNPPQSGPSPLDFPSEDDENPTHLHGQDESESESVIEFDLDLDEHIEPGLAEAPDIERGDEVYELGSYDLKEDLDEFATTGYPVDAPLRSDATEPPASEEPADVPDMVAEPELLAGPHLTGSETTIEPDADPQDSLKQDPEQEPTAEDLSSVASTPSDPPSIEPLQPIASSDVADHTSSEAVAELSKRSDDEADVSSSVGAAVPTPDESAIAIAAPAEELPAIDLAPSADTPDPTEPSSSATETHVAVAEMAPDPTAAPVDQTRVEPIEEPTPETVVDAASPAHTDVLPLAEPSSKGGGHRRKQQQQQKSARARKDKLRSTTTPKPDVVVVPSPPADPPVAAQAAASSKSGWLIPADKPSKFETGAPEFMPAPPVPFSSTPQPIVSYQQPVAPVAPASMLPAAPVFPTLPAHGAPPRFATFGIARTPAAPAPVAAHPVAAAPVTLKPVERLSTVKIKAEPPAGYRPATKTRRVGRNVGQSLEPAASMPELFRGPTFPEPAPSRGFPWKLAVAAVVLVAAAIVVGRSYLPGGVLGKAPVEETPATLPPAEPEETKGGPAPKDAGQIIVKTEPAGAKVLIDGKPAGESPVTLNAIPAGRHVLTFVSSSGSVKRTVRVVAGKSVSLDVPIFSGWVSVLAPFVVDVAEDGKSLGTTEMGRIMLAPGRHHLLLTNSDLGYSVEKDIEITAGEVGSVRIDPRGQANFNAIPWAEVWSDGRKIGDTPIANHTLPLGSQEFVFRHPQFGERKVTATIRAGQPAAIAVDFTKPHQP